MLRYIRCGTRKINNKKIIIPNPDNYRAWGPAKTKKTAEVRKQKGKVNP